MRSSSAAALAAASACQRERVSHRADRSLQTVVQAEPARPEARHRKRRRVCLALDQSFVQRRNRLSRSRDFDAVYRQGRSVSTRFLVLYWFPREDVDGEPRLGLAVPKANGGAVARNKIKRQLREVWRALLPQVQRGRDYVLIVRPGLVEATEARGFDWLRERVDEVVQKAAA